jgi:hypothetical protein
MNPLAVPPQLSHSPSLSERAILKKQANRERFDRLASERESWQRRYLRVSAQLIKGTV